MQPTLAGIRTQTDVHSEKMHRPFVLVRYLPPQIEAAPRRSPFRSRHGQTPRLALEVFDKMPVRDLVAWNSMINMYAANGMPNEALTLYGRMGLDNVGLDKNLHAVNALVVHYTKCGNITEAKQIFDEMEERSIVSWTSLIVGMEALQGDGATEIALD
ncbi:hypothetical protein SASPL_104674 [Salvia splendens]|uniref:Pentatricopeptide repeat-containing protein n=1 Tax=Salvia splendens TaxID=180675 RepID=A0A8X8YP18_SALSN|nr:hypothetical protein SASPL_104674 [Salvia splendens]